MRVNYELSKSPATWDFVNFLARAEEQRLERMQDGISLRISFGQRFQSPRDRAFSDARKLWRIHNLLISLARCLPSVVDAALGPGVQTLGYLPPAGPQKPRLEAPGYAREALGAYLASKPNPVSITLRASDFEPQRNSDLPGWRAAVDWLKERGYSPIAVPDAEGAVRGAEAPIGCEEYVPAALYPELRLALYEACAVNLMAAGGPMELCLNAAVPVMIWKLQVEGLPMNSDKNLERRGFLPMQDFGPLKRLYLEPDDEANLLEKLEQEVPRFAALVNERKAA